MSDDLAKLRAEADRLVMAVLTARAAGDPALLSHALEWINQCPDNVSVGAWRARVLLSAISRACATGLEIVVNLGSIELIMGEPLPKEVGDAAIDIIEGQLEQLTGLDEDIAANLERLTHAKLGGFFKAETELVLALVGREADATEAKLVLLWAIELAHGCVKSVGEVLGVSAEEYLQIVGLRLCLR